MLDQGICNLISLCLLCAILPCISTVSLPQPHLLLAQVLHSDGLGPQQEIKQTLEALVQAAADWQAAGLQRQGSNTGACLRTNFLLMADIVVKQDSHLLVEEEKQLLECFQVACFACTQPDDAKPTMRCYMNNCPLSIWCRLEMSAARLPKCVAIWQQLQHQQIFMQAGLVIVRHFNSRRCCVTGSG